MATQARDMDGLVDTYLASLRSDRDTKAAQLDDAHARILALEHELARANAAAVAESCTRPRCRNEAHALKQSEADLSVALDKLDLKRAMVRETAAQAKKYRCRLTAAREHLALKDAALAVNTVRIQELTATAAKLESIVNAMYANSCPSVSNLSDTLAQVPPPASPSAMSTQSQPQPALPVPPPPPPPPPLPLLPLLPLLPRPPEVTREESTKEAHDLVTELQQSLAILAALPALEPLPIDISDDTDDETLEPASSDAPAKALLSRQTPQRPQLNLNVALATPITERYTRHQSRRGSVDRDDAELAAPSSSQTACGDLATELPLETRTRDVPVATPTEYREKAPQPKRSKPSAALMFTPISPPSRPRVYPPISNARPTPMRQTTLLEATARRSATAAMPIVSPMARKRTLEQAMAQDPDFGSRDKVSLELTISKRSRTDQMSAITVSDSESESTAPSSSMPSAVVGGVAAAHASHIPARVPTLVETSSLSSVPPSSVTMDGSFVFPGLALPDLPPPLPVAPPLAAPLGVTVSQGSTLDGDVELVSAPSDDKVVVTAAAAAAAAADPVEVGVQRRSDEASRRATAGGKRTTVKVYTEASRRTSGPAALAFTAATTTKTTAPGAGGGGGARSRCPQPQYTETVRNKAAREKMHASDCACCRQFYQVAGVVADGDVQARLQRVSRHRTMHVPKSTPEGFWDVGFPATLPEHKDDYVPPPPPVRQDDGDAPVATAAPPPPPRRTTISSIESRDDRQFPVSAAKMRASKASTPKVHPSRKGTTLF
ncbi:hypothetical protein BC828DRAFT_418083 [Blastocladiella britannica]|nr:hypothetical protein BC828DRAFT_418083 [Blastocladiella britannica]